MAQEEIDVCVCYPETPAAGAEAPPLSPEYEKVSESLLAVYPPHQDIITMLDACGNTSVYFFQVLARPYTELQTAGLVDINQLRDRHTSKTHPVLIARQMLMIAAAVQYTNVEAREDIEGLTEQPRVVMKRLADTAIRLVSSVDGMMGTVEGLECIILECIYQSNYGNLRRAWLAWRRAIGVGQLMCLHRHNYAPLRSLQPNYGPDPQFLWYRLVYVDRFLSLMLGLPQASLDKSMGSEAALKGDTLLGQFERRLCVAAGKVLERNERDPSALDFATTQEIDHELQVAAATMPSKWWLPPNLAAALDDEKLFWEMSRLFSQIYHFNLLNQLHLPYMLLSAPGPDQRRFDYSRITCVNASRELLSRYIMFRSYNHIANCCRVIDFFALLAALTLVLAHLDGHRTAKRTDNVLVHQRLSDRAMMEQVLENMEMVGALNADVFSNKSADLLRQVLAVEADAAMGASYRLGKGFDAVAAGDGDASTMQLWVPYIGLITIARDGEITRASSKPGGSGSSVPPSSNPAKDLHHQTEPAASYPDQRGLAAVLPAQAEVVFESEECPSRSQSQAQGLERPAGSEPQPMMGVDMSGGDRFETHLSGLGDSPAAQSLYPDLTAGPDQWAFQGVDMAFFDTLMRESNPHPDGSGVIDGFGQSRGRALGSGVGWYG